MLKNELMLKKELKVLDGVNVAMEGRKFTFTGTKGSLSRVFSHPHVAMTSSGDMLTITSDTDRKKSRAIVGTWRVLSQNMMKGVSSGWQAELKSVYSHFPVKLKVDREWFIIENFLGEKSSRKVKIPSGARVEIKESAVIVTGIDKETVGQMAASIEQAVRIRGFDKRVFQDGIYITRKPYIVKSE